MKEARRQIQVEPGPPVTGGRLNVTIGESTPFWLTYEEARELAKLLAFMGKKDQTDPY